MRGLTITLVSFLSSTVFSAPAQPLEGRPYEYVAVPANRTFDYVIIGGGLSGLTVAARLAENPAITVGVIEAGDFYENVNGNKSSVPGYGASVAAPGVVFDLTTTPQTGLGGRTASYITGKVIGGSTSINLIAYHRSVKGAYDAWANAVGDTEYKFSNFQPHMRKAVTFTPANAAVRAQNATIPAASVGSYDAKGGPVSITFANWAIPVSSFAAAGWKSLGLSTLNDLTSGVLIGNQYTPMAIRASDQSRSTSASFIDYAVNSGRTNLYIFTNCLAKKITFNSNKKAKSVLFQANGGTFELTARKEITLSAGVVHSPQLLLVSGIGPSDAIKQLNIPVIKALPGVGKNWQEHPNFRMAYGANAVTMSSFSDPTFAAASIKEYNENRTGILTHNMADYFAWEKVPSSQLSAQAKADLAVLPADWPHYEIVLADVAFGPGNSVQGIAMLQAVTSRGTISISSADINDPPILDIATLATSTDAEIAVAAFKRIRAFFATSSLQKITTSEIFPNSTVASDTQILEWVRANIGTGSHGCCTAKMGKSGDVNAVVDSKARVYGVTGLRVVDASALNILLPAHPVSTLYGFAEKIADDIKKG